MMPFVEIAPVSITNPADLVASCIERGAQAVLVPAGVMPAVLFDLSSGVAGEFVQKLVNYGIRMAVIVPDLHVHSQRFQEFAREANRRGQFGFFPDRSAAVAWLVSAA